MRNPYAGLISGKLGWTKPFANAGDIMCIGLPSASFLGPQRVVHSRPLPNNSPPEPEQSVGAYHIPPLAMSCPTRAASRQEYSCPPPAEMSPEVSAS